MTDSSDELIENSSLTSQTVRSDGVFICFVCNCFCEFSLEHKVNISLSVKQEEIDKKEKLTAGLNQTVNELQQLLQTVSRQLSKGQEGVRTANMTRWEHFRSMHHEMLTLCTCDFRQDADKDLPTV